MQENIFPEHFCDVCLLVLHDNPARKWYRMCQSLLWDVLPIADDGVADSSTLPVGWFITKSDGFSFASYMVSYENVPLFHFHDIASDNFDSVGFWL